MQPTLAGDNVALKVYFCIIGIWEEIQKVSLKKSFTRFGGRMPSASPGNPGQDHTPRGRLLLVHFLIRLFPFVLTSGLSASAPEFRHPGRP